MPQNIEIKARIHNLTAFHNLAKKISNINGTIINQHDTFFNVNKGRLKFRRILVRTLYVKSFEIQILYIFIQIVSRTNR